MNMATINEAAKALGINAQKLRRGVESGKYPFVPIGTRKLVDIDKLREIMGPEEATIGIKEASELTGLSEKTIRRGIREGWMPNQRHGKAYELKPGEIIAALQRMEVRK